MRARQRQHGRPHHMDEGDKTRHRISRQSNERRAADDPHRDGTSRFDRHPPQHQPADAFDRGLDVILLAGRNAAGGQDQIVASRRPVFKPCASDARSSRKMPRSLTSQPSRASIAISMKRLESNNCAGLRRPPGDTSSLPVENTATRMRRRTSICVRPNAAASATSCGRSRRPAASAAVPELECLRPPGAHWRRAASPPAQQPCRRHRARTSSCMNTVSAPSGIGAPVKIRIGVARARPVPPPRRRPECVPITGERRFLAAAADRCSRTA